MTVSSTTRKAGPYSGNGVTVAFPFAFKVFAAADVLVVLTDADGVEVEQVLNSDYTLALNADQNANPGGTITMLAAPAAGYRVTATSQVANLQPTDITNNGGFYPEVLEDAHDRSVIQVQQLAESVSRSMVMPLSSDLASFQLTDGATAAGRALKVIGFDASGNPTLLGDIGDGLLGMVQLEIGSYALLRAYTGDQDTFYVRGLSNIFDGGHGVFRVDVADTTTADNGGAVLVDAAGRRWKREMGVFVDLRWFCGATLTSAALVQAAIDFAADNERVLWVPSGTYTLTPATSKTDEAGTNVAALLMRSNMHIEAEPGATFKIADSVSTDAAPLRHSMFFSNEFLSDISIVGLTMDMNGANNKISPLRPASYNRYTNAQIIFSGTPGGVAAGANNVLLERNVFRNNAGVSCIVMAQSNTVGVTLGDNWKIKGNTFENVGLDTDDHSSVFGWATGVEVSGNTFKNTAAYDSTTSTGGLVAYEVHGSNLRFTNNRIKNYYQGLWISSNLTETEVRNVVISDNEATVSQTFLDFYSANLSSGASSESAIQHVEVSGNIVEITADAVSDTIKAFFKIAARRQPSLVRIEGNICRSYETTKNCVLALLIVSPDQLGKGDHLTIRDNTASGVVAGLVSYFGGDPGKEDLDLVEFANNRLGTLLASPGALLQNADVYLYGANPGKINALRVGGLEHVTAPIVTDAHASGRARVYGKALLPTAVGWANITVGNGSTTKRVALDTDAGHAMISALLTAGSTSSAAGAIALTFTGITANSNAAASATHVKTGAAVAVPALTLSGTSQVTMYGAAGALFGTAAEFATSSVIGVNAQIPCQYADI